MSKHEKTLRRKRKKSDRALSVKVLVAAMGALFLGVGVSPAEASILFGVTGDGAATPESLFTISTLDASTTFQTALGNGNDGEGIAFNPNDGLLYHTSGFGDEFFETVNPTTLAVGPNLAGGSYGPDPADEIKAIEWYEPLGVFLVGDISGDFFHVTPGGQFSLVVDIGHEGRGFAVTGTRVFSVGNINNGLNNFLYEINPNTGALINTLPLTVDGVPTTGNGLATDPDTGIVYGMLKDPSNPGGGRLLATIDVDTGAATSIGNTGEKFAGITFTPEPGTLALLALGAVGLAGRRSRRQRHDN